MKTKARWYAPLILCLAGCGRAPEAGPPAKEGAAAPPPSGVTMVVTINKLVSDEGEELTESLKTHENPTPALVEEKYSAIAWDNPKLRPTVGIARAEKGRLISVLKITRPRDSKATTAVSAEWINYQKSEMHAAPLDTPATGLKLLQAYLQDEKLDDMAKWKRVE